eukprot:jgi/Chlat1/7185/Chrsp57S06752
MDVAGRVGALTTATTTGLQPRSHPWRPRCQLRPQARLERLVFAATCSRARYLVPFRPALRALRRQLRHGRALRSPQPWHSPHAIGAPTVLIAASLYPRRPQSKPPLEEKEWSVTQRRRLTNVFTILNIVVFAAQILTRGALTRWGAKDNAAIAAGQWWRLLTPALLHGGIMHLLVNSTSLNSVGPVVESLFGPGRFLAIYGVSAFSGSFVSYWYSRPPSVGASAAIFGLVGALLVFYKRNLRILGRLAQSEVRSLVGVVLINLMLGATAGKVDNWGHLGGLIGGAATSWVLGPALEMRQVRGRRRVVDRPPIANLLQGTGSA